MITKNIFMDKFILFFSIFILAGCTTIPSVHPHAFKYINPDELSTSYNNKELGKVVIFTGQNFNGRSNLTVFRSHYTINVGQISNNEGFIFYLPENTYSFWLSLGTTKPILTEFKVQGGKTTILRWDKIGFKPVNVQTIPNDVKILASGSLYDHIQLKNYLGELKLVKQPKFHYEYDEPKNGFTNLTITLESILDIEGLWINSINRSDLLKTRDNVVKLPIELNPGNNIMQIRVVNSEGYSSIQDFNIDVLTDKEKRAIAEKLKQDEIRIANERLARKQEEERIAKEGDGSPDDLTCKKYGFKPLTEGYSQCRMKIDFAKAESQRQQEQYEREKRAYENQIAQIEKERQRQRSLRQIELGLRLLGGQPPVDAVNSLGTGAPIAPRPPSPITQIITLPNGRPMHCTTFGNITNCN